MRIHVNQIFLDGEDNWTLAFNHCSALFQKANDPSNSEEERNEYWKEYIEARQRLELGIY